MSAPPPDLTRLPDTDPTEIYRLRDGLYAPDLLGAAVVHLDFFTWLADHPSDQATISRELQLVDRPLDVMLTLFAALGLVEQKAGVFLVTPLGREHLSTHSPRCLGPYFAALKERPVCLDFVSVLKTGRTANWGSFKEEKEWARAMEEEAFANGFTAAMDTRGVFLGPALARTIDASRLTRLLDVAGGSGVYACAMVARHAHLQAAVLEKPPVDQVARRIIESRGFSSRVEVVAGDILKEEFPGGFDAHLISNVLHDWDVPVTVELIRRSYRALVPGGMLLIHDAHINEDKTGPLPVAKYSALLMHSTEGKCYSVAEIREYLGQAGFVGFRFQETAADRSVITATKPRSLSYS